MNEISIVAPYSLAQCRAKLENVDLSYQRLTGEISAMLGFISEDQFAVRIWDKRPFVGQLALYLNDIRIYGNLEAISDNETQIEARVQITWLTWGNIFSMIWLILVTVFFGIMVGQIGTVLLGFVVAFLFFITQILYNFFFRLSFHSPILKRIQHEFETRSSFGEYKAKS